MADVLDLLLTLSWRELTAVVAIGIGVLTALYSLRTLPRAATWWHGSVAAATPGDRATVVGTVRPAETTTRSPTTNDDCLVYRNDVGSYRSKVGDPRFTTKEDFDDAYGHGVAFELDDGTGTVLVDPAEMTLYGRPVETDDGDEAAAKRFASKRGANFVQNPDLSRSDVNVNLTARQLEPGDTATVTGIVEKRDGEAVLVGSDGVLGFTGSVVTSDRSGYLRYLFGRALKKGVLAAAAVAFLVVAFRLVT